MPIIKHSPKQVVKYASVFYLKTVLIVSSVFRTSIVETRAGGARE